MRLTRKCRRYTSDRSDLLASPVCTRMLPSADRIVRRSCMDTVYHSSIPTFRAGTLHRRNDGFREIWLRGDEVSATLWLESFALTV